MPKASKKDYVAIARIIKKSRTKTGIARSLAKYFKETNPNFSAKWNKAIGLKKRK